VPVGIVDTVGGDLPLPVAGHVAVGVPASDIDVQVDRVPFWLAVATDAPYQRETAPFQRQQIDQQPEAGEQSLAGWWTRSQMSFQFGAGLDYLDTISRPQPEDRLRFHTSRNVDCWTPGVIRRLNGTTLTRSAPSSEPVHLFVTDTADSVLLVRETAVEFWNGTSWTSVDWSATPIRAVACDGASYYVATETAVRKGAVTGGATTVVYNLPGTTVPMQLGWVKQRLMLGHGAAVYELDTAASSAALPTAKYTHPVSSWTWTAFVEGPTAILGAGYAGLSSGVFSFSLEDVSGTPTLGPGVATVTLPAGERVMSALQYVGSLLVLGTSRGVRVCPFDTFYGSVSLGPLSVESETPVTALGGFDRYIWAGTTVAAETSLVRLDLSAPLDQLGHYAWAPDLVFPDDGTWTEDVTSITFFSTGRKAVGVTGRGYVSEDDGTNAAEPAWFETARIRMGTVEHKHWSYVTLRGLYGDEAPIGVSVATPEQPTFANVFVTTDNTERFAMHRQPSEWIALRFDLSEGAELASYQVQALPAGNRQRLISIPVQLFDYQQTRSGVVLGYDGWARDRLRQIEALEYAGAELTVAAPALFPEAIVGTIERLVYTQPNDPGDRGDGTGGSLLIVVRTTS
jgi:hypothetical protein